MPLFLRTIVEQLPGLLHGPQELAAQRAAVGARVQQSCAGLQGLSLSRNGITDWGAQALADAIDQDDRIAVLNLNGNQLSQTSQTLFTEAMLRHPSLAYMDLCCNPEGDSGEGKKRPKQRIEVQPVPAPRRGGNGKGQHPAGGAAAGGANAAAASSALASMLLSLQNPKIVAACAQGAPAPPAQRRLPTAGSLQRAQIVVDTEPQPAGHADSVLIDSSKLGGQVRLDGHLSSLQCWMLLRRCRAVTRRVL